MTFFVSFSPLYPLLLQWLLRDWDFMMRFLGWLDTCKTTLQFIYGIICLYIVLIICLIQILRKVTSENYIYICIQGVPKIASVLTIHFKIYAHYKCDISPFPCKVSIVTKNT